jgi:hypothetical protein
MGKAVRDQSTHAKRDQSEHSAFPAPLCGPPHQNFNSDEFTPMNWSLGDKGDDMGVEGGSARQRRAVVRSNRSLIEMIDFPFLQAGPAFRSREIIECLSSTPFTLP